MFLLGVRLNLLIVGVTLHLRLFLANNPVSEMDSNHVVAGSTRWVCCSVEALVEAAGSSAEGATVVLRVLMMGQDKHDGHVVLSKRLTMGQDPVWMTNFV